jgi:predicted Zn-dependent protease
MSARPAAALALGLLLPLAAPPAAAQLPSWANRVKKTVETVADANVRLSPAEEASLGRAVAANLIARFGLVEDEALTHYVALVGTYVASLSDRPDLRFRFGILDTEEINAFACPGGYVFVTRGALSLAGDESELAALLAHEVQHVTERHGAESIEAAYRNKVITGGLLDVAATSGAADPRLVRVFGELTDELTQTLLETGLSRKLELEADRAAVGLLDVTGYDPQALPRVLDRLDAPGRPVGVLKRTHPPASRRAKEARDAMSERKLESRPDRRFPDKLAAAVGSAATPAQ